MFAIAVLVSIVIGIATVVFSPPADPMTLRQAPADASQPEPASEAGVIPAGR